MKNKRTRLCAILRVAECAGADGVFIPEPRAVGLTETVAKSSAGATEYVKIAKVGNLNHLIDELKQITFGLSARQAEKILKQIIPIGTGREKRRLFWGAREKAYIVLRLKNVMRR